MVTHAYDLNYTTIREHDRVFVSSQELAGIPGEVICFRQHDDMILRAFVLFDNSKTGWFNCADVMKIGGAK